MFDIGRSAALPSIVASVNCIEIVVVAGFFFVARV